MKSVSLAFFLGVILLHQHSSLPNIYFAWLIIPLIFAVKYKAARLVTCISIGYLWALWVASAYLADELSAELEGQDIVVIGVVDSLAVAEERRITFDFKVLEASYQGKDVYVPKRIKLN